MSTIGKLVFMFWYKILTSNATVFLLTKFCLLSEVLAILMSLELKLLESLTASPYSFFMGCCLVFQLTWTKNNKIHSFPY